ncbi:hypothetical protein HZH66_014879 [Vespula vulgaris]|uniref:Uncharacterized protein n=1 Tax=Vespula vulgaris TaxID=7454 RepID=A0A834IZZ3_VESVU|nr:hypothetical protein HZH66_014879 [Vespula vulgaris]
MTKLSRKFPIWISKGRIQFYTRGVSVRSSMACLYSPSLPTDPLKLEPRKGVQGGGGEGCLFRSFGSRNSHDELLREEEEEEEEEKKEEDEDGGKGGGRDGVAQNDFHQSAERRPVNADTAKSMISICCQCQPTFARWSHLLASAAAAQDHCWRGLPVDTRSYSKDGRTYEELEKVDE